ncbi:MAG: hypothetical protein M0P57_03945 [Syntrophales bacterium]|jgi:hypothetical protein|nr:hypothetical protein [Syntrophales bacterium]MDY0044005.1 hypothetical protein [Syntrophales bacterium]
METRSEDINNKQPAAPPETIQKYLDHYGSCIKWHAAAPSLKGIENVVVIPALAESESLFKTLGSLSRNSPVELKKTLVLCVINNRKSDGDSNSDYKDNRTTLKLLDSIVTKVPGRLDRSEIREIFERKLQIGYIDASSPGLELPAEKGGVGLARKIGMDASLTFFDYGVQSPKLIFSLDADTLVDTGYLSTIRNRFVQGRISAAVIAFSHQPNEDGNLNDAILWYETFMRYYTLGLEYACSPYAYHSIGSAIVSTAEAYVSVRGMSVRDAGEDFHYLNKLAKAVTLSKIEDIRVYPSSRVSCRVPFGTGKTIARLQKDRSSRYKVYAPEIFTILKRWLECLQHHAQEDGMFLLKRADTISAALTEFLVKENFPVIWTKLRKNSSKKNVTIRHAMTWFDALKTFRLVRYMTHHGYPAVDMYPALAHILALRGVNPPGGIDEMPLPARETRKVVLDILRKQEKLCPANVEADMHENPAY